MKHPSKFSCLFSNQAQRGLDGVWFEEPMGFPRFQTEYDAWLYSRGRVENLIYYKFRFVGGESYDINPSWENAPFRIEFLWDSKTEKQSLRIVANIK